MEEEKNIFTG